MKHLEKLKEALCEELDKFGKSGDITVNSLEKIHKLTDTIKNIDKIMMLEEEGGYSEGYMDDGMMHGSSYARGRRYAKRDSMGRYSGDGGYSEDDDYSERRMGRGYSRDEATDHLMRQLGNMMEDADPKQRETLKKWMRELERD
jgi:hypothetical protein